MRKFELSLFLFKLFTISNVIKSIYRILDCLLFESLANIPLISKTTKPCLDFIITYDKFKQKFINFDLVSYSHSPNIDKLKFKSDLIIVKIEQIFVKIG